MNAITRINRIHFNLELYAIYALLIMLFMLMISYMYLLSASVLHVVMSKELEEKTYLVNAETATLEAEYMEKQHAISGEIVKQSGYVKTIDKIFINKEPVSIVTKR